MQNRGKLFAVIALVIVGSAVYFTLQYVALRSEVRNLQEKASSSTCDEKTLLFARMFVDKVLRAEGEISFEDRLRLENSVRDLNDDETVIAWNAFVNSGTEKEAQDAVKNLLSLLMTKIKK